MYKVRIYNEFNNDLKDLWDSLINKSEHTFYQTYEINSHWYKTIGSKLSGSKLKIFVFYKNSNIVSIAPLIIRLNSTYINELNFLGYKLFDYLMIIRINNDINLDKFMFNQFKQLKGVDIIKLSNIPQFFTNFNNDYSSHINYNSKNKVLMSELPEKYELYFSNLKTSLRGDIRRQKKKIFNEGKISYDIINHDNHDHFIDNLVFYKKKRYNKTGVKDIFKSNENYLIFLKKLKDSVICDNIHCSTLSIDNSPISFHIGFTYNNKYYYYMPSFCEDKWGKFSPSRLHLLEIINDCIDKKIPLFDFTIGDENYKKYFTNKVSYINNYRISLSFIGLLYFLVFDFLKKIKSKLYNFKNFNKY